jgi:hypothetical protein
MLLGFVYFVLSAGLYESYTELFQQSLILGVIIFLCILSITYYSKPVWIASIKKKQFDKYWLRRFRKKFFKGNTKDFKDFSKNYNRYIIQRDFSVWSIIVDFIFKLIELVDLVKNILKVLILDKFIYKILDKIFFRK